ncbi:response regulator transcription factor [Alkalicella caledoniensis]|uniref:Response regulator transcription factor n=2 Tax=Alkalicella caledoniensis TaxID=2731377 RepID=A0A7G9WD68_ALKCA|nr:response regulator transcription factor [Alkalicella caledoniensis]
MKIKERSLVALSRKENEVVNLLLQGLDDREIAKQLFISDKTVRNHISNILQKICLRNRTQLVLWALQEMGEIEQLS